MSGAHARKCYRPRMLAHCGATSVHAIAAVVARRVRRLWRSHQEAVMVLMLDGADCYAIPMSHPYARSWGDDPRNLIGVYARDGCDHETLRARVLDDLAEHVALAS